MEKFFIVEILKDDDVRTGDGSDIDIVNAILYDSYKETEEVLDELIKIFWNDEKEDFRIAKIEI